MKRRDECKYNKQISCFEQNKCSKCNWNPTYFEEKKRKAREERERKKEELKKRWKERMFLVINAVIGI